LGTVVNVHMENLLAQMDDRLAQSKAAEPAVQMTAGQIVAVVVSPGAGLDRVFRASAVSIVSGGQTMNPSTADILAAFDDLPTDKAVILPNNKNIQLAAQLAAQQATGAGKHVHVIPTRTVPQGLAAMLSFDPDGDLAAVAEAMTRRISDVETGEVTTATRTVELDSVAVSEGQIIGLHNGKLACAAESPDAAVVALLGQMNAADHELLTLFYGNGLSRAQADATAAAVGAQYANLEVEVYEGGQPHYHYIFSLE
jgi:dihydroxyacetone kinase-like predicted kinase